MKIIKSFKITPNVISKYKSSYLLKICDETETETEAGSWFVYVFNKYYETHSFDPIGLVKIIENEIQFDNGKKLIRHNINDKDVYYYGSIDLLFNIKLLVPIEEKEPGPVSYLEINKRYNAIKNIPYFKAVYKN